MNENLSKQAKKLWASIRVKMRTVIKRAISEICNYYAQASAKYPKRHTAYN